MSKLNEDGNVIGRVGAIALIVAAGFGLHRLSNDGGMCPMMKTDSCSCCSGMKHAQAETDKAAPAAAADDTAE
jgi:hypothetical protein